MKQNKKLLYISIILLVIPVVIFVYWFKDFSISDYPENWETFAVYFGGTVGTIGSIIVGFFIYKTLDLQNKQRIEETLFGYLNSSKDIKTQVSQVFNQEEKLIHEAVKKNYKLNK